MVADKLWPVRPLHLLFGAPLFVCGVGCSSSEPDESEPEAEEPAEQIVEEEERPSDGSGGSAAGDELAESGGSSSSAGGSEATVSLPTGTIPFQEFFSFEAEDGETNGEILGPSREIETVASESSGRRSVRINATGEYVAIHSNEVSNAIVVRYSIPDGGQNYWTTLSVYVDGEFRTKLDVTSRYSWTYGGELSFNIPAEHENPAFGRPHHFFDEARALVGNIPAGARVSVQKDPDDSAAHYDIDLIELEQVAAPASQPEGTINIVDCGATPNDATDDSAAIQECMVNAREMGRGVFIPEGTFRTLSAPLSVPGITVSGAGMWYSQISGFHARFDCYIPGCRFRDFAILGDTVHRDDTSPETAFGGNGSSNVIVERIWVEHTKTGYWTGAETQNLTIRESRFRNLMADGVNLYGGTSNSIVENCHFRNTGDDAVAAWSHGIHSQSRGNVIRGNYIQLPWKASCLALYGGESTRIEDNVCADVVQYPGIFLSREFGSHPFSGMTQIENNSLIRAGGFSFGSWHGALKFRAAEGPIAGVEITGLSIVEPGASAIQFQGDAVTDSLWLTDIEITSPGDSVFHFHHSAQGAADATGIVATGAPQGIRDEAEGAFSLLVHDGNSGW